MSVGIRAEPAAPGPAATRCAPCRGPGAVVRRRALAVRWPESSPSVRACAAADRAGSPRSSRARLPVELRRGPGLRRVLGGAFEKVPPVYAVAVEQRQPPRPTPVFVAAPMHPRSQAVDQEVLDADHDNAQAVHVGLGSPRLFARQQTPPPGVRFGSQLAQRSVLVWVHGSIIQPERTAARRPARPRAFAGAIPTADAPKHSRKANYRPTRRPRAFRGVLGPRNRRAINGLTTDGVSGRRLWPWMAASVSSPRTSLQPIDYKRKNPEKPGFLRRKG